MREVSTTNYKNRPAKTKLRAHQGGRSKRGEAESRKAGAHGWRVRGVVDIQTEAMLLVLFVAKPMLARRYAIWLDGLRTTLYLRSHMCASACSTGSFMTAHISSIESRHVLRRD